MEQKRRVRHPLTEQQKKVLDFIRQAARGGLPPTLAEIAEQMGWRSNNSAVCVLVALEKKGWLTRLPGKKSRGIVLT